jgi:hypothetical protein
LYRWSGNSTTRPRSLQQPLSRNDAGADFSSGEALRSVLAFDDPQDSWNRDAQGRITSYEQDATDHNDDPHIDGVADFREIYSPGCGELLAFRGSPTCLTATNGPVLGYTADLSSRDAALAPSRPSHSGDRSGSPRVPAVQTERWGSSAPTSQPR